MGIVKRGEVAQSALTSTDLPERFVIEVGGDAVGVAVHERGGYRFFAARADFDALNRHVFASAAAAETACRGHLTAAVKGRGHT